MTETRNTRMVNMERLLSIRIEDLNQKRVPLSQMEIQAKALSLYNDLKTIDDIENEGEGTSEHFFVGGFFVLSNKLVFTMFVLLANLPV